MTNVIPLPIGKEQFTALLVPAAHEAVRQWCHMHQREAPTSWEELDGEGRKMVQALVKVATANMGRTLEEIHEEWCDKAYVDGWRYGVTFDVKEKTAPKLKSYDDLDDVDKGMDQVLRCVLVGMMQAFMYLRPAKGGSA